MLSLKEAARISGESKIGQIDTAELLRHRVYGLGTGDGYAPGVKVEQDAAGWDRAEMALLQAQIDTQRQTIELLRNELSDVKKNRDAWRCRADQLRQWISADVADSPRAGSFAASPATSNAFPAALNSNSGAALIDELNAAGIPVPPHHMAMPRGFEAIQR